MFEATTQLNCKFGVCADASAQEEEQQQLVAFTDLAALPQVEEREKDPC